MKNEVFARAITGIDDELIVSAHENTAKKNKNLKRFFICAAAACIAIICGITLLAQKNGGAEISVYGNIISDKAVAIDVPAPMSADLGRMISNVVAVPLEIAVDNKAYIKATDGTIEVFSSESDEFLYSGQSFKASDSVTVLWRIDEPEPGNIYKLSINNNAAVLLLSYDENLNNWIIKKQ